MVILVFYLNMAKPPWLNTVVLDFSTFINGAFPTQIKGDYSYISMYFKSINMKNYYVGSYTSSFQ